MVKFVKTEEEFSGLMEQSKTSLVVIDFTASWCGPCRFIAPVIEKMSEEMADVIFVKIDVDEAQELAAKCGIRSMPTFQFYKGGEKVHEFSGASEAMLKEKVNELK